MVEQTALGLAARKFRPIATEEAFLIPEVVAAAAKRFEKGGSNSSADAHVFRLQTSGGEYAKDFNRRLLDLDEERLRIMDENGIDMQLLSHSGGIQGLEPDEAVPLAALANDRLAETIARHPTRYAGLASFAPQAPQQAAKEIERAINTLKLNGLIVYSHTNGEYLDEPKYRPVLEAAAAVNTPLYLHPRSPSPQMIAPFQPDLVLSIWGYQVDASLHAMRLIVSGVFDDIPNLRIVLGHGGEGIPYWFDRIDVRYQVSSLRRRKLKMLPSEYFKKHFTITTSGMNWSPVLKYCIGVLGADKIAFAVDYPYEETTRAVEGLLTADITDADKAQIFRTTSERVFKIRQAT